MSIVWAILEKIAFLLVGWFLTEYIVNSSDLDYDYNSAVTKVTLLKLIKNNNNNKSELHLQINQLAKTVLLKEFF